MRSEPLVDIDAILDGAVAVETERRQSVEFLEEQQLLHPVFRKIRDRLEVLNERLCQEIEAAIAREESIFDLLAQAYLVVGDVSAEINQR